MDRITPSGPGTSAGSLDGPGPHTQPQAPPGEIPPAPPQPHPERPYPPHPERPNPPHPGRPYPPPPDRPDLPQINPDFDPDIPQHPGPPLQDPEVPH